MRPGDKFYSILYFLLLSAAFFYLANFILFSDIRKLVSSTPDDASYYLGIAENYSGGLGFTFDGINKTNGFQPLWQILLIPVFSFLKTSPEAMLRIVLSIQLILITASSLIFSQILAFYFEKILILLSGSIFIIFVFFQSVNGMETSLMIFMISILLFTVIKMKIFSERNIKREIIWGVLLGLLMLIRLDTVFIVISIIVFNLCYILFISKTKKGDFLRIFIILIAATLTVLPYLFYNYISFGNIIPISVYLKHGFDEVSFTATLKEIFRYRETYFALTGIIYFTWFLLNSKRIKQNTNYFFCLCLAALELGIMFSFVYLIFFLDWVIFYWYFIPYSLFISLAICIPAQYILSFKKIINGGILILSVTFLISFYWGYKIYIGYRTVYDNPLGNWSVESYNAAQWSQANTDPSDVFAMKDTGHFGFFSKRNVINLDGLVNNFEYQEILKNKKLNEYLKNNKVKYIVQHAIWNRDDLVEGKYDTLNLNYMSHKYSVQSDPVIVKKENEVYRSAPYFDGKNKVVFLIWKLNP